MEYIKPPALKPGDTLGIFTPSSPGYELNRGLFLNGIKNLKELGFDIKLGKLTEKEASQGYRSGPPKQRAEEFMALIRDDNIKGMVATIGGYNSSSLIPYLDFDTIRKHPKVICGFSDITSLHLPILAYSGLRTFYGPCVLTWFGEWPNGILESTDSFLDATSRHLEGTRKILPPKKWSKHMRNWANDDWKTIPRKFEENKGWKVLSPGKARGPILALNLNTLTSAAGTSYFPDMEGKVLLLEEMSAPYNGQERSLMQLNIMGVFDKISALIVGKPEVLDTQGALFSYDELIKEVIGKRDYPIISEFDCSHTVPMVTLAQMTDVSIEATGDYDVSFQVMESMVSP